MCRSLVRVAAKPPLALRRLLGEHAAEVEITGLVVGGIGVGDVVGQHLCTLGAKAQRLFVDAKCLVETDAHVWPSAGYKFACAYSSKAHAIKHKSLIFRTSNLAVSPVASKAASRFIAADRHLA